MMGWLSVVLGSQALAAPLHGCTFYKSRLVASSWPGGLQTGCANFEVEPLSCTKTKVVGPTTISYPGDVVSGRLPAYFIEVTPHRGYSIFTIDPDGAVLRVQMGAADAYWEQTLAAMFPAAAAVTELVPFSENGTHENSPGNNGGLLFGRTLKVPYAGLAWSFPSVGVASGSVFPTCFAGISEFTPGTWSDVPGHGEQALAALQAPLAAAMCNQDFSGILFPELGLESPFDADALRNLCAFPTIATAVMGSVWEPTSEAMEAFTNPQDVCAGRLGPHLPRTGLVNTSSEWDAVNTIAYRMATLSEDHWFTGPGIEGGDRWQLIWPPAASPGAHSCYRPGELRPLELLTNGPIEWPELPLTDGALRPGGASVVGYNEGASGYVFAVWRRFSKCVEPFQGPLFAADLTVLQPARAALCTVMNSTDGMP
jgi:hypothetical protein